MENEALAYKELTKTSYQLTADEFALKVKDLAPLASIERFLSFLPDQAKIIDIGCGSGRDAKLFSEKGASVLGIDYCANLLEIAQKNDPLSDYRLMDIEEMTLPDAFFDGAWAGSSLVHIAKQKIPEVFNRIHRMLKDGGYFYLTLKKGQGEVFERDLRYEKPIKKFWSYYEKKELTSLLQAAEFKIIELEVIEKKHSYQSHDAIRVFAQK